MYEIEETALRYAFKVIGKRTHRGKTLNHTKLKCCAPHCKNFHDVCQINLDNLCGSNNVIF